MGEEQRPQHPTNKLCVRNSPTQLAEGCGRHVTSLSLSAPVPETQAVTPRLGGRQPWTEPRASTSEALCGCRAPVLKSRICAGLGRGIAVGWFCRTVSDHVSHGLTFQTQSVASPVRVATSPAHSVPVETNRPSSVPSRPCLKAAAASVSVLDPLPVPRDPCPEQLAVRPGTTQPRFLRPVSFPDAHTKRNS